MLAPWTLLSGTAHISPSWVSCGVSILEGFFFSGTLAGKHPYYLANRYLHLIRHYFIKYGHHVVKFKLSTQTGPWETWSMHYINASSSLNISWAKKKKKEPTWKPAFTSLHIAKIAWQPWHSYGVCDYMNMITSKYHYFNIKSIYFSYFWIGITVIQSGLCEVLLTLILNVSIKSMLRCAPHCGPY